MTLGQRIAAARTKAGLTQVELANKLSVSRQAITKWENDRGIPDIENLKALATLFGVSLDYLLATSGEFSPKVWTEPIDITRYTKSGSQRSRFDAAVRSKYPEAEIIYPLVRRRKLTVWESIVDFVVQPGVLGVADSLKDRSAYYVVNLGDRDLLVNVTKEFIESKDLVNRFTERKKVIGENRFIKSTYTI